MLKGMARQKAPIVFKSGVPVSVICVASTFTSLSYANNGGKVQITSAGIHGLTTSPAVGASVYVSWSGGTGVSGLYTVLSVDSTTAITVDLVYVAGLGSPTVAATGVTISLVSITLPALSPTSRIRLSAQSTITSSTNSRELKITLNGNSVLNRATSSPNNIISIEGYIQNRGRTNEQVCSGYTQTESLSSTTYIYRTSDTSVSTILSISAFMGAANEFLRLEGYGIEVFI